MVPNNREYQDLLLAAWLHDIGKFYQRAGFKLDTLKDEESMTMFARKEGEGPNARYTHLHAIFSDKFFREYLPKFDIAGTLTAAHHSPEKTEMRYLAKLITLADWMASGERRDRESEDESEGFQAEPLISIFSRLKKDKDQKEKEEKPTYVPLVELEASLEDIFPVETKDQAFRAGDGKNSYKILWEKFIADLNRLDKSELLEQIPFLLEKYTLTIPSTTLEKPDLSLYHHAKSTAAIVSCLYKLQLGEKMLDLLFKEIMDWLRDSKKSIEEREKSLKEHFSDWPNLRKQDFLLVGGDISGIQDFIYSVTSEKALKGLKGRSFYLQLISEVSSQLILNEFDLTEANLLYSGGGHFYLLLPKSEEAENKLTEIRRKIDEVLLQAHKGKLAILVDWVPITYADFFINFASIWTGLSAKLGEMKKKKFSSLFASSEIEKYWEKIMGPFDVGGERKACEICSEELEEPDEEMCPLCQSFVSLSDELKRAIAMRLEKTEPQPLSESFSSLTWKNVLLALGFDCRFWKGRREEEEPEVEEKEMEKQKHLKNYLILNSTDFAGRFRGYKFVATKITDPTGQTLTLEDMADKAEGIKKWAILKADVDGLGNVFSEGLGEDKTISRLSMLSSMLSLYFGARLNHLHKLKEDIERSEIPAAEKNQLLKEVEIEKDKQIDDLLNYIYLVYSGGDDLLLIGPWSVLPFLAARIYDDFHRFASKKLTLSAGLYLAPSKKFPVYQAAQDAHDAVDEAKEAGRNRVCFLDRPMTWEKFKEVRQIAYKIKNLLIGENQQSNEKEGQEELAIKRKGKTVPRALLSVLYDAYKEKELKKEDEIPMERIWRLFYAFKKIMTRFKKEDKELKDLEWLLNKAVTDHEIYPELNVAARWAEYLTREEKT